MKKIVLFLFVAPILAAAGFLGYKYQTNPTTIVPYPYLLDQKQYGKNTDDAPILIIGDRMGFRLGQFAQVLSERISADLSKPIKVATLATKGEGIHRTLARVKNMGKLPLFMIYLGGSQETHESKFSTGDMKNILFNFKLYEDEKVQTALMLLPEISRFIYKNINHQKMSEKIQEDKTKYDDYIRQKRNEIEFKLYGYHLNELFSYAREHNSIMLAISPPVNIDIPPKASCAYSIDESNMEKLNQVLDHVREEDFKSAYNISRELTLMAPSNAKVHFIHGKICKQLGKNKEAKRALRYASAFDCKSWRSTPVFNAILKRMARQNEILFFDFDKYLMDNWRKNITFEDEIYPQNFYMEKMVTIIAGRIKKMLKL
jgi:hypothetical protein